MAHQKKRTPQDYQKYLTKLNNSFPYFYTELCRIVKLKPPGRARLDIADWMQNGPRKRGVLAMRKIGKTPIACAYNLWLLFKNPQEQILHTSASAQLAEDSVLLERKWIAAVSFLQHLSPRPKSESKDRDNVARFDVGCADTTTLHSPSVTAVGITGQLPGTGASHINPDDIETMENTLTHSARKLLVARAEELEHLAFAGASILYIGTPHNEESIYRERETMGYVFRAWPLVYPGPDEIVPNLAPMLQDDLDSGRAKPGDPVFPEVFSAEECLKRKQSMSSAGWAMQCMMRTDLLEKEVRPLRLSDFIVYEMLRDKAPAETQWGKVAEDGISTECRDIDSVGFGLDRFYEAASVSKTLLPFQGCKAGIDPAGRGADETAWAIVAQLQGFLYIKEVGGVHGGATPENLEKIVLSLREHDVREVYVESQFGMGMLVPLLEPIIRKYSRRAGEDVQYPEGWGCTCEEVRAAGQKEIRIIETIEPVLQQHRLVISPRVAMDKVLTYQLTRLTREPGCLEHDDRIDALALVISQWSSYLNQDAQAATKRRTEEAQLALLEKYRKRSDKVRPHLWGNFQW